MLSKEKTAPASKKSAKVMKIPAGKIAAKRAKRMTIDSKRSSAAATDKAKRLDIKDSRRVLSRNMSLTRVTSLFFGFVLVYILQSLFSFALKPHTVIDRVASGSVISPVELSGVIVRDEKVYKSTASGTVRFNVVENERVKKGDVICSVLNADEVDRINAELADVNEEMLKIQAIRADITDINGNERRLSLLMKNMLDDWPGRMNANDFSSVYALKDSISANIGLRNQIILSDGSEAVQEQSGKRQMYQDELNRNMTPVLSEESGIVSSLLDGCEDTYTTNITAMLQKEQTIQKKNPERLLTVKTAKPDTPLFKIINSNIWYIASYIPNDIVKDWKENDTKSIYINADIRLPVTIERIAEAGKESYVLFKCTRFMEDFITTRYINFKVSGDINEGFKIPQSSAITKTLLCIPREYISIEDDQLKRASVTKSGGDKIILNYTALDDDMAYVDTANSIITLGTELQSLAEPQTMIQLSQMADITGVYRVNNGTADFRKVTLNNETRDAGYYILDPNRNKGIQENDGIVHDAALVTEGQIVF